MDPGRFEELSRRVGAAASGAPRCASWPRPWSPRRRWAGSRLTRSPPASPSSAARRRARSAQRPALLLRPLQEEPLPVQEEGAACWAPLEGALCCSQPDKAAANRHGGECSVLNGRPRGEQRRHADGSPRPVRCLRRSLLAVTAPARCWPAGPAGPGHARLRGGPLAGAGAGGGDRRACWSRAASCRGRSATATRTAAPRSAAAIIAAAASARGANRWSTPARGRCRSKRCAAPTRSTTSPGPAARRQAPAPGGTLATGRAPATDEGGWRWTSGASAELTKQIAAAPSRRGMVRALAGGWPRRCWPP